MRLHRWVAFVCVSLIGGSGLAVEASPGAQSRAASREVRSKLFKQVMTDFAELRECVEKEEGGARAAEENATVDEVDLNRDGVPEYEVQISKLRQARWPSRSRIESGP